MAQEIKSEEILIKFDGKLIAKATSFSLEVNKETIDTSNLYSGGWAKALGGKKSWSVSTDALVSRGTETGETKYSDLLLSLISSDEPVELIMTSSIEGDFFYRGNVILTGLSKSGSDGEIMTYSASFTGDGELFQEVVTAP